MFIDWELILVWLSIAKIFVDVASNPKILALLCSIVAIGIVYSWRKKK
jgi:hypothetical protein